MIEPVSLTLFNQVIARMKFIQIWLVVLRGDKSADYGILYRFDVAELKANGT